MWILILRIVKLVAPAVVTHFVLMNVIIAVLGFWDRFKEKL